MRSGFRSSEAEDIEELSIQQNEEVKAKATEKSKGVVKDLQKTIKTPLTGEELLFFSPFLVSF